MPVTWEGENDRKILLYVLKRVSAKDINFDNLATIIPGATSKAVLEHIAKLRREAKNINGLVEAATSNIASASEVSPAPTPVKAGKGTGTGTGKPRGRPRKDAGEVGGKGGGGKRKRGGILADAEDGGVNGEEAGIGSAQDDEEEGLDTKKVKVEQDEGEEGQVEEGVLGGYGGDLESRNRSHAVD